MNDFISYQVSRTIFFLLYILPVGLVVPLVDFLDALSPRMPLLTGIMLLLYFLYAGFWASRSAHLFVYSNTPFRPAISHARIQINADIRVYLSFVPLLGPYLSRRSVDRDPPADGRPRTLEEWDKMRRAGK